ncbi:TAXI family TRAP transporter solute-binding subunit [Methylocella sp.]|uniref:TAXI family TRAP transporter solute-binding subunit n=1 Tax=Methylocella sp. TaxID=1978226 RepID=UPI003783E125
MRRTWLWAIGLAVVALAVLAAFHFWSLKADLRVATGPKGSVAYRFMEAFAELAQKDHPRVRVELVPVADLAASSKAVETGTAELAIVRSDAATPSNGETIAILRRDAVAFLTPPKSPVDSVGALSGRTVAIPAGPLESFDSQALDTILSYFDVSPASVKRIFLPANEIGEAIRAHHAAAAFAVGPVGPGPVVDVVRSMTARGGGAPTLLAIDEADAINQRFPGFESLDAPAGAFRGRPEVPGDTVTTLAVTYRLVSPDVMPDAVAGAIARSLFRTKARLEAMTPLAAQIEAPDPDAKNPVLPVHPGVASYLNEGDQSFFDEIQQYLYLGGLGLSIAGSLAAVLVSSLNRRKSLGERRQIDRLLQLADDALSAQEEDLKTLETDLKGVVAWFVTTQSVDASNAAAFEIAISHARHAIDIRRQMLRPGGPGEGPGHAPPGETSARSAALA